MPGDPNKLSQFWQELKRRNVTRVLAVYIAAGFMIFEFVDMISEPFSLPDWSMKVAFFILIGGLVITVIVSWIYDIHSEGGLVKTEAAHVDKKDEFPSSSKNWQIASYISFVVIVGLVVLNIIPRTSKTEILDKSIAVLPFRNDSPDQERMYFINGTMEAILDHLCKIQDLRVPGRTSVEQYRENPKPITTIAEEMNVSYILEGSGHRDGNNVRVVVQLLDGKKDRHLWSKTYDADIEEIYSMQSEIAQLVAAEIEVIITPEEKVLIDKVPTTSLTAYDFYQQGKEEYWKSMNGLSIDLGSLERAKKLFNIALDYDSAFADAYIGLADVYRVKQPYTESISENYLDSLMFYANRALEFNDQHAEAYGIRGSYFIQHHQLEEAINDLDKAISIKPSYYHAYIQKGNLYSSFLNDPVKSLYNYHKALSLSKGGNQSDLLQSIGYEFARIGFPEKSREYFQQALEQNGDSALYYYYISLLTEDYGFLASKDILYKGYRMDTSNLFIIWELAGVHLSLSEYAESLYFYERVLDLFEKMGSLPILSLQHIGYAYWRNGNKKKAEYFFTEALKYNLGAVEIGRSFEINYYNLAAVYTFRGEEEKAYESLRDLRERAIHKSWMIQLNADPLFDNIRNDPEFQQIVRDIEAKYQAEHERVRQWLKENDML